jgi:hypothetical protein
MTAPSSSLCFGRCAVWLSVLALLLGLVLIPRALAAQDPVEATLTESVTVPISLPKLKTRLKPIDDNVRVALLLSTSPDPSAYLVAPLKAPLNGYWYGADQVRRVVSQGSNTAKKYTLALTSPSSERLTEIVQGLFTHTTFYREGAVPASEDIQFHAKVMPEFIEGGETGMQGLTVRISLTITDAESHQIAVIEAKNHTLPQGGHRFAWSIKDTWAKIAADALNEAFDSLIKAFNANQPLKARLREFAQDRDLPASITTTARFNDEMALLPNSKLDAGDEGVLLVQVANKGPGTAYGVTVRVSAALPQVSIVGQGTIGDLTPGESKELALRVTGNLDLPSTIASLRIETLEKRGYGARPLLFELPTAQLVPSHLEIVDVTLNDRTGRAKGTAMASPPMARRSRPSCGCATPAQGRPWVWRLRWHRPRWLLKSSTRKSY